MKNDHQTTNTVCLYTRIQRKRMANMYFKDPCNTTPRKFVKVNITAREEVALVRQKYAEQLKIDFPNLPDGCDKVCRGSYLDINFNNNTSKVVTRW